AHQSRTHPPEGPSLKNLGEGEGGPWRRVIAGQKPACIAGRGTLALLWNEHEDHIDGREVSERRDLDGLVNVNISRADARDHSDRNVAWIERREPRRSPSGSDDQVVLPDHLVLRPEVEYQVLAGPLAVADQAVGPRVGVAARDGEVAVREQ